MGWYLLTDITVWTPSIDRTIRRPDLLPLLTDTTVWTLPTDHVPVSTDTIVRTPLSP